MELLKETSNLKEINYNHLEEVLNLNVLNEQSNFIEGIDKYLKKQVGENVMVINLEDMLEI